MRCKTCDYPLWQLSARACPECGAPFKPSDFDFNINSVRFCCPHCAQAYYGTGPRGHLVPDQFACVTCARPVSMDEMVLLPAEGVSETRTEADWMPWLDRRGRGAAAAWFATIWRSMIEPHRLIRATPVGSSVGTAFAFSAITNLAIALVSALPIVGLFLLMSLVGPAGGGMTPALAMLGFYGVWYVVLIVLLCLYALLAHAILAVSGGTEHGLRRTLHAVFYGSGANALTVVPCAGAYFGWIWVVVSATLMLKEGHRVSGWRAALAGVAPPVLLVVAIVSAWIGVAIWTAPTAAAFAPPPGTFSSTSPAASTAPVVGALTVYAANHQGSGPAHASELVADGSLNIWQFVGGVSGWSSTMPRNVPVGNTNLQQLQSVRRGMQRATCQLAASQLPPNTAAYRLGDFVFTDRGVDYSNAAHGPVWVVIASPDPGINPRATPPTYAIGLADGSTLTVQASTFPSDLAAQNRLRSGLGLPALPPPEQVLHGTPATSASVPVPPDDTEEPGGP